MAQPKSAIYLVLEMAATGVPKDDEDVHNRLKSAWGNSEPQKPLTSAQANVEVSNLIVEYRGQQTLPEFVNAILLVLENSIMPLADIDTLKGPFLVDFDTIKSALRRKLGLPRAISR